MDDTDTRYLERALDLAENASGNTSPNPIVGAVIVKGGRVLGEGWHLGPGHDHAETAAIKDAVLRGGGASLGDAGLLEASIVRRECMGATIYVTLEPCCTQGRTPPCTDALISGGLARVVVGAIDPNPAVFGKGVEILRAAGIRVEVADGPLAHRARRQNNGLRKAMTHGLPFVTYKYAMSVDGRLATDSGDSRWISSGESRALVHQWRAWSDAVVVGVGTVESDDPRLTARGVHCSRQPLRVVLDRGLVLSRERALVQTVSEGPVLVVCGEGVGDAKRKEMQSWGVETATAECDASGELDPLSVCRLLAARHIQTVLLEGGHRVAAAWWNSGVVDKLAAFVCPRVLAGSKDFGAFHGPGARSPEDGLLLREVEIRQVGPDLLVCGYAGEPF